MRKVGIVGIGHTAFGNLSEFELSDIMAYASTDALEDAGIAGKKGIIDQVVAGSMGAGFLNRQSGLASALVSNLNLEPASAELVENGPASGASAVKVGRKSTLDMIAGLILPASR